MYLLITTVDFVHRIKISVRHEWHFHFLSFILQRTRLKRNLKHVITFKGQLISIYAYLKSNPVTLTWLKKMVEMTMARGKDYILKMGSNHHLNTRIFLSLNNWESFALGEVCALLHLTVSEIQPRQTFSLHLAPAHPSGHHGWKQSWRAVG